MTLRMGLISSVLIALRLGPINSSRNRKWARMCSVELCSMRSAGSLLALAVFSILESWDFLLRERKGTGDMQRHTV